MDKYDLKDRLSEYLISCGFELNTHKKPPRITCPNPSHEDNDPSAIVYEDKIHCPVCGGKAWDVFDVAGFVENTDKFKEQQAAVMKALGVEKIDSSKRTKPKKQPPKKKPEKMGDQYVRLPLDEARRIYSHDNIQQFYDKIAELKKKDNPGTLTAIWPYKDELENVILVDARFENGDVKKNGELRKETISIWWNGKHLKSKDPPDMIYGLDQLEQFPDKPVLVVEGCKTAFAASRMDHFVVMTWRGGTNRVDKHDWSSLKKRKVYILPDDDKPGIKAAAVLKSILPNAQIVRPYELAREIKKSGADCVEYLELLSPEKLADYIFKNSIDSDSEEKPTDQDRPFKVMGRASENDTYFIDRDGWLIGSPHGAYNKQFCLRLAPLTWWKNESGFSNEKNRNVYWDDVLCWLIGESNIDFDPSTIRGRGAWKSPEGDLCFNDGRRIWGSVDKKCHYLKRQTLNIDLDHAQATPAERKAVLDATLRVIFETRMDAIRTLAWATLSPFGGALPWRSAALLTGSSGSGKSTIIDNIIKPIAFPLTVSGGESTEAGVRQAIGSDSRSVVIEEAEKDTQKKAGRRDDLFSLMRQSTSDDAPIVAKGTQDGKGMSFQLRSMFLFAAISPEVAQIADDNRIFKLNLRSATRDDHSEWESVKKQLVDSFSPRVCAGIRSFTWQNIKRIVSFADKIATHIQEITGRGTRYALAESLFLSCYFIVYCGKNDDSIEDIKEEITDLIWLAPKEETRDDAVEMLERILDENIFISSERGNRTIGELARILGEGRILDEEGIQEETYISVLPGDTKDYRHAIGRHGVTVSKSGDLCIAMNHHRICEITGSARGYHLTLRRIENKTEERVCKFAGESKRAIVFPGYYKPDLGEEGDY